MKTKQIKRQEAAVRQAKWDALTPAEKLEALRKRPGNCARQLARLN